MIQDTWIKIDTDKFPILPGEEDEIVNEGMYGKALCEYLQHKLPLFGLTVNFYCAEDWGWWLDVTEQDFNFGLLVYSHSVIGANAYQYAIGSSVTEQLKWSWKKFRKIDVSGPVIAAMDKVETNLEHDLDIHLVERYSEFPPFNDDYT